MAELSGSVGVGVRKALRQTGAIRVGRDSARDDLTAVGLTHLMTDPQVYAKQKSTK